MDASSNDLKMDGFIDDVRIYNSTLSTGQISQLFDEKADANALVNHYTFDPTSFNVGFEIVNMSPTDLEIFNRMFEKYGSQKAAKKRSDDYLWGDRR